MNLTKKEIIERVNKLIVEGRIFEGTDITGVKLSELMEAYKVERFSRFDKHTYSCVLCGKKLGEADVFVICRLKGTSYKWRTVCPIHLKCLKEV